MIRRAAVLGFVLALSLCGCKDNSGRLLQLERELADIRLKLMLKEEELGFRHIVVLDLEKSSGFQSLHTSTGLLLVSLDYVTSSPEGLLVALRIGNPMSADYPSCELIVRWGAPWDPRQDVESWRTALSERTIKLTDTLHQGSWNKVKVHLQGVKKEDLRYLEVELQPSVVSFGEGRGNEAVLDPASQEGFQMVRSGDWFFPVMVDKVEAYVDGCKVFLKVGNPFSAAFGGCTCTVAWGTRPPDDRDELPSWKTTLREKVFEIKDELEPSSWNVLDFVLPDTKPEAFGHLTVALSTRSLSLRTPSPEK